jgi:hypothetical protein
VLRIFAVAFVLAGIMIAAKEHRILARTHVVGSCTTVATAADGSEWRACESGRLSGKPSLERDSCKDAGPRAKVELWHCPAPLQPDATR